MNIHWDSLFVDPIARAARAQLSTRLDYLPVDHLLALPAFEVPHATVFPLALWLADSSLALCVLVLPYRQVAHRITEVALWFPVLSLDAAVLAA